MVVGMALERAQSLDVALARPCRLCMGLGHRMACAPGMACRLGMERA